MRKIKSERNVKKLKNSVNDFYMFWIKHPGLIERFKGLSNKEVMQTSARLRIVVDNLYLKLRVEEKYMYWNNLYVLYDLLCMYFTKENKFLKLLEEKTNEKKVVKKIEEKYKIDVIENQLGYETAFRNEIDKKADETLHWLFICLNKYLNYYHGRLKKDNPTELSNEVVRIIENFDKSYTRKEKLIDKEIHYINMILRRVKYAREHIDVIFSITHNDYDKKYRTMIKSSMTRIEKLMQLVIDEIEGAYAA